MTVNHLSNQAVPRARPLFAEDFDGAPTQAQSVPEVIAPVFTTAELSMARTDAWTEGHEAGLAEAAIEHSAALRNVAHSIAEQLAGIREAAHRQAEVHAEAVANLLLDTLGTLFPEFCSRHGEFEAQALIRVVLTGLDQEPVITLRADRVLAMFLADEIGKANEPSRINVITSEMEMPGDVRITWQNGSASRQASVLWEQVAAVLGGIGLRCATQVTEMQDAA